MALSEKKDQTGILPPPIAAVVGSMRTTNRDGGKTHRLLNAESPADGEDSTVARAPDGVRSRLECDPVIIRVGLAG